MQEGQTMTDHTPSQQPADKDRLVSRPADPLPTPLDPASPEARGHPADPKPVPPDGQGDPDATNPAPDDIGRTA
jgi:hypothetical protein